MSSTNTSLLSVARKLVPGHQIVDFYLPDASDSIEVCAKEVSVKPSAGNHESGSSKVKLHNIVDYTWEERFYTGQLLAVHMEGIYIAYGIKAANKTVGVVRVVNKSTNERTLIKGMEGTVQDIAFAYVPSELLLACMDNKGNLFIHSVEEQQDGMVKRLVSQLVLHILPDPEYIPQQGEFYRVNWCPYIPEVSYEDDEGTIFNDEVARCLVLTRGNKVELWSVKMVTEKIGAGPVRPGELTEDYLEILEHKKPIVAAAFSPDGTAVVTASLDGDVNFFQVYMHDAKQLRCLHHWQPHRGQPLSSLFFLDNHKNYNPEINFWKFAITGANNNSELKVWSCESWTCLQTLLFEERPDRPIKLNASLDLASGFFLLSDFHHKVLYVMQLYSNNCSSSAAVVSISEFLLPYPILSFGIVDAGVEHFKSDNLEEVCHDENDEESVPAVSIRMYLVQPKSLQDCQIAFIPPEPGSYDRTQLLPPDTLVNGDTLNNLPLTNGDLDPKHKPELPANHSSLLNLMTPDSSLLNLMTPDAFNSPIKHEKSGSCLLLSHSEETYSNTTTLVASPHSPEEANSTLLAGGVIGYNFASGGSSPSREVQEILGEGKCFYPEAEELDVGHEMEHQESKVGSSVWPDIPILRATEVRKNEEQARKSVIQEGNCSKDGDDWKLCQRLEASISSMIHVMNSLMQASEEQAAEIKQLREEMQQQNLLREIDKLVTHHSQQQTHVLDSILASLDNKRQQEALATAVSQSVVSLLSTKLVDSVNKEISQAIVPSVLSQLESLKRDVQGDLSKKLSTTDHLLKENISKLVHSKSVIDVLSGAVVAGLTPVISQYYKEYFTNFALPSFEKACSAMFNQINDTFSKGSKEFVCNLDSQSRRLLERNREQSLQLQTLSEILKSNTADMNKDLKKSVVNVEKQVLEAVNKALTAQQATFENSVMAVVRSRAVTPAPHMIDTQLQQTQILQLIQQGQINCAFQQALSASDLSLVMLICEKVNPQELFSQVPCPLQQHVLLSLVQQLSADMNNHTEIKHKYLEGALIHIDVNNSVTREHLPVVLSNLQRQLQTYIANNPNNRITRSMRILLMASQAVLGNCVPTPL